MIYFENIDIYGSSIHYILIHCYEPASFLCGSDGQLIAASDAPALAQHLQRHSRGWHEA
jgi:hypothetical protein